MSDDEFELCFDEEEEESHIDPPQLHQQPLRVHQSANPKQVTFEGPGEATANPEGQLNGSSHVNPSDTASLFARRTINDRVSRPVDGDAEGPQFIRKVFLASSSITSSFLHRLRTAEAKAVAEETLIASEAGVSSSSQALLVPRGAASSSAKIVPIDMPLAAASKAKRKTTKTSIADKKGTGAGASTAAVVPKAVGVRVPASLVRSSRRTAEGGAGKRGREDVTKLASGATAMASQPQSRPAKKKHYSSREESAIMEDLLYS